MIKFRCSNCHKKFGVPDDYAGHRIRCNTCNQHTIVPQPGDAASTPPSAPDVQSDLSDEELLTAEDIFGSPQSTPKTVNQAAPAELTEANGEIVVRSSNAHTDSQDYELKLAPPDQPPPPDPKLEAIRQASLQRAQSQSDADDSEETTTRPVPVNEVVKDPVSLWPLVFPLRGAAMGIIGVFALCELIIAYVGLFPMFTAFGLITFFISLTIRAYICWYLYLCVQTAAEGKIRSPDILSEEQGDFTDLILRLIRMLLAVLVCMAPLGVYAWITIKYVYLEYVWYNVWFWSLFAAGLFFLPMAILAVVMHDSAAGLNPFLILRSILRTLPGYLVLAAWFSIPAGCIFFVNLYSARLGWWFTLPAEVISLYCCVVAAAMLGRFFYNNEKRLNWF